MTATMTAPNTTTANPREFLKRAGNPFRNYFARNPDDEVCARYHVPELFAAERDLLHAIIDLYRYDPMTHSEVVPVLGNKGAGKTHLLHSIKHGVGGQWQLLVTPGVFQKDTDFLEYLLFQIIDTLLGGGKQKGCRPMEFVGDQLVRRQLGLALRELQPADKVEPFPPPGIGRWGRRLGLGNTQASERAEWLIENLSGYANFARVPMPLTQALAGAGLTPQRAFDLCAAYSARTEPHNTAGLIRRSVLTGFARATLLGDEAELASFLTYGFAELDFNVKPSRQDLVLALFKVLTDVFRGLKIPVVVAFDQLEDLLLARRNDDSHRVAEAFFAGIVQVMHQLDGICILVFAERGLWNRFVPSLDGYIQDRLNNPVHVPRFGTVKALRLEAPPVDLVQRVCEARLRPVLDEVPDSASLGELYPFSADQIDRIARTEPTLRDMLQQFRHLFDHMIYGPDDAVPIPSPKKPARTGENLDFVPDSISTTSDGEAKNRLDDFGPFPVLPATPETSFGPIPVPGSESTGDEYNTNRLSALLGNDFDTLPEPTAPMLPVSVKNYDIIEMPTNEEIGTRSTTSTELHEPAEEQSAEVPTAPEFDEEKSHRPTVLSPTNMTELWDQEYRSARRKLEPEGALTGATRELQAALGTFLSTCHEHGVKVGPWRLQHVVPEWPFGEHPTYGVVSLAHWACKDGQPWKVGVGLFLARGPGKPKDLEIKLGVMETQPQVVDHLILLRPEDDLNLTGKSKTLWQEAEKRGKHARLEPASLDGFAMLYSFPRWLSALRESLPDGSPLPNLADLIQEKAEKLLEQVCMPIH
jgi:hypothetical protein